MVEKPQLDMHWLTKFAFYIDSILYGFELTIFEPIEYFYFKSIVQDNYVIVFYSLSSATPIIASLMSSVLISWLVRRYQKFRETVFILTFLSCLGYSFYISRIYYLVFIGKIITGISKSTHVIAVFYFTTFYTKEDVIYEMSLQTSLSTAASIVGPMFAYVFLYVDVYIGTLHVTYENVPGVFLLILKLILIVLSVFIANDVPTKEGESSCLFSKDCVISLCCLGHLFGKQQGHQKNNCGDEEIDNLIKNDSNTLAGDKCTGIDEQFENQYSPSKKHEMPLRSALDDLWQNDIKFVFVVVMFFGMTFKIINSILPIESSKYLYWKVPSIASISLVNVIFGTFLSLTITMCSEKVNYQYTLFCGMLTSIIAIILLAILPNRYLSNTASTIIFYLLSLFNVSSSCLLSVSIVIISQEITIPTLLSLTNGIRVICMEMSYFFGALLIFLVHMSLEISGYVGSVLGVVSFIVLLVVKSRIRGHK